MNVQTRDGLTLLPTDVQLAASADNWNPTGLSSAVVLRVSSIGSAPNVTGLAGGVTGRMLLLICTGGAFTVTNEDTGSAAANRFTLKSSGLTLGADGSPGMLLYYDGSRWREIAFDN